MKEQNERCQSMEMNFNIGRTSEALVSWGHMHNIFCVFVHIASDLLAAISSHQPPRRSATTIVYTHQNDGVPPHEPQSIVFRFETPRILYTRVSSCHSLFSSHLTYNGIQPGVRMIISLPEPPPAPFTACASTPFREGFRTPLFDKEIRKKILQISSQKITTLY